MKIKFLFLIILIGQLIWTSELSVFGKSSTQPEDTQVLLQIHSVISPVHYSDTVKKSARSPQSPSNSDLSQTELEPVSPLVPKKDGVPLVSGSLTEWREGPVNLLVDHLVDSHFAMTPDAVSKVKCVDHFRKAPQVAAAKLKDSINYSLPFQGVEPSRRMSQLVLSDEAKVRDAVTAEYEKQTYVDKIHAQVIGCLMQVAMALGTVDRTKAQNLLKSGMERLTVLAGDDQANAAKSMLLKMSASKNVSKAVYDAEPWDSISRDENLNLIVRTAMEKDPVVLELKKHVEKYAHPGKIKSKTSGVVESLLSGASWFGPGFALPLASEAALNAYIMSTGGSEEGKIERILVYSKRLESRKQLYTQEASLALDNYRFGQVTHNKTLLLFSEALIAEITTPETATTIFGHALDIAPNVVPALKTSKRNEDAS